MDLIYKMSDKFDDGILNNIYGFLGMHPVAKITGHKVIDTFFDNLYREYLDIDCAFMFRSG